MDDVRGGLVQPALEFRPHPGIGPRERVLLRERGLEPADTVGVADAVRLAGLSREHLDLVTQLLERLRAQGGVRLGAAAPLRGEPVHDEADSHGAPGATRAREARMTSRSVSS